MTELSAALYSKPRVAHREPWIQAFAAGLRKHGVKVEEFEYHPSIVRDADLHIFWSLRANEVIDHCRQKNQPFVCLDRGVTHDRMDFTAISLNGLNGRSELDLSDFADDHSRRLKHGWDLKGEKSGGDKIIIVGQKNNDKSLEGNDIYDWASKKVISLRDSGVHEEILFRPHPLERKEEQHRWTEVGVPISLRPMQEAFAEAKRFVTYSSTTGAEAWINGVAATADSPVSVIYRDQVLPFTIDTRTKWLNRLSFAQYGKDEMRNGEAWEILGGRIIGHPPQPQTVLKNGLGTKL